MKHDISARCRASRSVKQSSCISASGALPLAGDAAQCDGPVDMRLPAAADSLHQVLLCRVVPLHSLPKVEIISPQMWVDILQGKDINLAVLLMQGNDPEQELSQHTTHVPGGDKATIFPVQGPTIE